MVLDSHEFQDDYSHPGWVNTRTYIEESEIIMNSARFFDQGDFSRLWKNGENRSIIFELKYSRGTRLI
jgi:hypothetical protein